MSGELVGADKLRRRLKAIGDTRPLLRTIQLDAVAEAKKRVPRRTGHLARSIGPGSLTGSSAIVHARTNYAPIVELGSRPHVIKPKNKRVLAWPAGGTRLSGRARTGSGRRIFARIVHHPGTKPQPFLVPGAIAALGRAGIKSIVKRWNDAA